MATITITYSAPAAFANDGATQQIFGVWNPASTASDNAAFEGTYYDTNVWDNGEFPYATTLQQFLAAQVAHPGLVAALRQAMKAGSYEWVTTDEEALYAEELNPALASQGFELSTGGSGQ